MAVRRKEVIKIMDERLSELGFSYNEKVSDRGVWGFSRIVDTSWCFDFPSESNRAQETVMIQKDPYGDGLYLILKICSAEGTGGGKDKRMDQLVQEKTGHWCVYYKSEKETPNKKYDNYLVSHGGRVEPVESFGEAVKILRDIAIEYGLDIMKGWERDSHGGPKDLCRILHDDYATLSREFEAKYLRDIPEEERMNEIRKLIIAQRNKRYDDTDNVLLEAAAHIGGRIIERYGAEWRWDAVRVKNLTGWGYFYIFIYTKVDSMWLDYAGCEDEWKELARFYVGEGVFEIENPIVAAF